MRKLTLTTLILAVLWCVPGAHASKYSTRDLGFVETGARPYRLVIFFDDTIAIQAKLAHTALEKDLLAANIDVLAVSLEQRKKHPEFDRIKLPDKLTHPVYWLIAPDGREIAIDPVMSKSELLRSPLRDAILHDVVESLCSVVLLESTDEFANKAAKSRAEAVLGQINRVRSKLDKSPAHDVKLLTLPSAGRAKERWLLWSLGEEPAAAAKPKVAVIFGNMRQAGPLFEGTEWDDELLFSCIAALGQWWDAGLGYKQFFTRRLVFLAPATWQADVEESVEFNPRDKARLAQIAAGFKEPTHLTTTPTFAELLARMKAAEGDGQKEDPPRPKDWPIEPPIEPVPLVVTGPWAARPIVSASILIAGVLGWILLGASVVFLERRQANA